MAHPKSLKTIGIALIALQTEFPRAQSLPPEVQAEIHEAASTETVLPISLSIIAKSGVRMTLARFVERADAR